MRPTSLGGILEESSEAYQSGGFLLERLGAERYLDPKLVATILTLRQRLIDEWATRSLNQIL